MFDEEEKVEYSPPPRDRIFWLTNFLHLFNIIVFISSLACMGLSAWILSTTAYMTSLLTIQQGEVTNMPSLLQQSAFVLVFVGIVLFVISIIGISGVYTEQVGIIKAFAVSLIFVILLELTVAILISIFKDKIQNKLKLSLKKSMTRDYIGNFNISSKFTLSLDWAMVEFECCGVDSFRDFEKAHLWKQTKEGEYAEVPKTCCKFEDKKFFPTQPDKLKLVDKKCPVFPTDKNSWRSIGCFPKLYTVTVYYITIIIAFGSTLLAMQLVGVVFSLFLAFFIVQRQQLYMELAEGHMPVLVN